MRTAVHAGYLVPDNHSQKEEIDYIIAQNIPSLIDLFTIPGVSKFYCAFGLVGDMPYTMNGAANVGANNFMEEFFCQATGRAIELGHTGFLPLLKYKAMHVTGRLTSGPDFCWQFAYNYSLRFRDSATSPIYTTWKEVFQKSAPTAALAAECGSPEMATALGTIQNGFTGYPNDTQGYPANGQPAVAYCATYNMPRADDAWLVFRGAATKPLYEYGPQFAILPREIPDEPLRLELFRAGSDGLGGAISTVVSGPAFFDDVTPSESSDGRVEFRIEYVRNTHPTKTLYDAVLWLSLNTPSPSTVIEAGRGTSARNGVEQVLADEKTAPVGITFLAANSKETGVYLGDLPPDSFVSVCYRRTVEPGAQATRSDAFTRTIEGMIE
jgi:hypothetical protein